MSGISAFGFDAAVFVVAPFLLRRLLRRIMPAAVLPILLGMVLTVCGAPIARFGAPSWAGNEIGWIGVLLLSFTAGIETRHPPQVEGDGATFPADALGLARVCGSAGLALALPFAIVTAVASRYLLVLPGWNPERGGGLLPAMAIGLCAAVSALPVLTGIVRELSPCHRRLGQISLTLAVVDDAALWIGLALLQAAASAGVSGRVWGLADIGAALVLPALFLVGRAAAARMPRPQTALLWVTAIIWLSVSTWASSRLGLHELIGAYFAGVVLPVAWTCRLPVERIGSIALLALAPLFFGHSGLKVAAGSLTAVTMAAAGALLILSIATKVGAIVLFPPRADLSRQQALAIGSLLQCKGLMEIVAATILADKRLLAPPAYAALVVLAVLSTTLTGPLFRMTIREREPLRTAVLVPEVD
jgi:Kef-type K+ transport system membrane component KefB